MRGFKCKDNLRSDGVLLEILMKKNTCGPDRYRISAAILQTHFCNSDRRKGQHPTQLTTDSKIYRFYDTSLNCERLEYHKFSAN